MLDRQKFAELVNDIRSNDGSVSGQLWVKYLAAKKQKIIEDALNKDRGPERDSLIDMARYIQDILDEVKPIPRKQN